MASKDPNQQPPSTQNAICCNYQANARETEVAEHETASMTISASRRRVHRGSDAPETQFSEHQPQHEGAKLTSAVPLSARVATYSTFAEPAEVENEAKKRHRKISSSERNELITDVLYSCFFSDVDPHTYPPAGRYGAEDSNKRSSYMEQLPWMVVVAAIACVAMSLYHVRGYIYDDLLEPDWKWDHNVYYSPARQRSQPSQSTSSSSGCSGLGGTECNRNMLIAQVSGGNSFLNEMASICSRPNRAYARRWGRDYVRYSRPVKNLARSCFDKVTLLDTILEHQQAALKNTNNNSNNWIQTTAQNRVIYDTIVLMPPDAIIMDLDDDLLELLPQDKLLAIAGWDGKSSIKDSNFADVLLVNIQHRHADAVVKIWKSLVEPPVTCGAGNDLSLLLNAVESILEEGEDISSFVVPLDENRRGMIANNSIKVIPLQVPGHKAKMLSATHSDSKAVLQTTADSVCYRYYPRCEVL